MKKQDKALQPLPPVETQQERFASLVVFGDEESGGKGLSVAQASQRCGISAATGRQWWRSHVVQSYVRENLDALRNEGRLKAAKHRDRALATMVKAMESPAFTPTQVKAAQLVWQWGMGDHEAAQQQVGIEVIVNTGLPTLALAQQQKRATRQEDIVEGEATPVE